MRSCLQLEAAVIQFNIGQLGWGPEGSAVTISQGPADTVRPTLGHVGRHCSKFVAVLGPGAAVEVRTKVRPVAATQDRNHFSLDYISGR